MLEARGETVPKRGMLESVFHQRFERYLARVHRYVSSRLTDRSQIEPLVERILVETIDDWMGPGEDTARAERVLSRALPLIRGGAQRNPTD
jgi:DNA-directed RNA polymerase specialized sigma24 family protein